MIVTPCCSTLPTGESLLWHLGDPTSLTLYLQGCSLTFSYSSLIYIAQCFLQFLKYVIVSEVPTVSLTGSALASGKSGLDLVGTGSVQHRGSL